MNLSEEWRFLWPISHSSQAPPLLPHDSSSSVGPLLLCPIPSTLTPLLSSQSLSPPSLLPIPSLSLPRFLETSSSVLPTTSSAIHASLPADSNASSSFATNRLEPLVCPDGRSTLAFFPTGDNMDHVGFVLLSVCDSQLRVKGDVFLSPNNFGHRILQLASREAADDDDDDDDCLGYLMASTMYSVYWFRVSLAARGTKSERPVLVFIGSKVFKSSCVVHVCWSPHLPEESLVLLESGQSFLFDVNDHSLTGSTGRFRGKRLPVSWDEHGKLAKGGGWLSCQFSWHPRILVLANSNAVFLVDLRFDKCSVDCLMKISLLGLTDAVDSDRFVNFCKAGSDGFHYVVASQCWLVLIDIRVPCKPVLQWMHSHQYPCYVSVFCLSRLRGNLGNEEYNQASQMGFAIVLGSFLTGDFSLFCYGPSPSSLKQSLSVNTPIKVSNPFYAWDLPSELSLSGLDCLCSSCLLREELAKEDLPEWIDWQQKKQLVLGFFIPDKAVSSLLSKADGGDAGFYLIRLLSSGKLESQRYSPCQDIPNKVECAHLEPAFNATDFNLCSLDEEYKFRKSFKYIKLEYLYAYMNGSLTDALFSKFKRLYEDVGRSKCPAAPSEEFISKKIKTYGLTDSTSSYSVSDAVRDISLPTSTYEAASKRMWTILPMDILGMAFSTYEECFGVLVDSKKTFLDFSAVPDQNQLPPFTLRKPSDRSNKWSKRVPPGDDFVGPVIPLPVSLTLKEICENGRSYIEKVNEFSADTELTRESQHVLHVSREFCVYHSNIATAPAADVYSVSLGKDSEEMWDVARNKSLYLYKPSAFLDALPDGGNPDESARYTTMIANVASDKQGSDTSSAVFNDLCPIDLKFEDPNEWNVGSKEMHAYAILEKQFKKWQDNFTPYADLCAQFKS